MARTRLKKESKNRGLLFKIAVVVFVVYALFNLVNLQIEINAKRNERDSDKAQLSMAKQNKRTLESILYNGNDDEYIERLAREKLDLSYPDERVFIEIPGN